MTAPTRVLPVPAQRSGELLVPSEAALAYTPELGWHLVPRPPDWWLEEALQD